MLITSAMSVRINFKLIKGRFLDVYRFEEERINRLEVVEVVQKVRGKKTWKKSKLIQKKGNNKENMKGSICMNSRSII